MRRDIYWHVIYFRNGESVERDFYATRPTIDIGFECDDIVDEIYNRGDEPLAVSYFDESGMENLIWSNRRY